jgi:5-methylcytosine-specific restriction endonuclease McrA
MYSYNTTIQPRILKSKSRDGQVQIEFKRKVKRRDNYTCQVCGTKRRNKLGVHHKDGFKENPHLRCYPPNGVTICDDCHDKYNLWSGGVNTKEYWQEFMEEYSVVV